MKSTNGITYELQATVGSEVVTGEETISSGIDAIITTASMKSITILSDDNNTDNIFVGQFPIQPGASITLSFSDVKNITVTTEGTDQKVYHIGVK